MPESDLSEQAALPIFIQLANMYAPSWGYGGPVRMLFDYARWFSRDHTTEVFSGDIHHDFSRLPEHVALIEGVTIQRQRIWFPVLVRKSIYLISPGMFFRPAGMVRRSARRAIVQFSELRGLVALYCLMLKQVFGDRVTLVHSAFGSLHYKAGGRRRYYDRLFMKWFLKSVDVRLAQNEHERDAYLQLCRRYGVRESGIHILPLHVNRDVARDSQFENGRKLEGVKRQLRRRYDVPQEALVCVFLGRLHPEKGVIRTVDAFLRFAGSSSRPAYLLIIGRDDGFQPQIEAHIAAKRAETQIRIVNNVYEQRFDYYFLSDIFLGFPTIFEETMLASVEALSCGTPIVVSREADIPFVEAEQAGMVIDFSVEVAAKAIATVAANLSAMQRNALGTAASHFDGEAAEVNLKALLDVPHRAHLRPSAAKASHPVESAFARAASEAGEQ